MQHEPLMLSAYFSDDPTSTSINQTMVYSHQPVQMAVHHTAHNLTTLVTLVITSSLFENSHTYKQSQLLSLLCSFSVATLSNNTQVIYSKLNQQNCKKLYSCQIFFRIRNSFKSVIDDDISDEMKKHDRLWKVRSVLDRVHKGCLQLLQSRDGSSDEQMIPFTGACQFRQYVQCAKCACTVRHGIPELLQRLHGHTSTSTSTSAVQIELDKPVP